MLRTASWIWTGLILAGLGRVFGDRDRHIKPGKLVLPRDPEELPMHRIRTAAHFAWFRRLRGAKVWVCQGHCPMWMVGR